MATLEKFKLLATQCAVASSPTRSPTTSPVTHLRRRKTLRMLLGRPGGRSLPPCCDDGSPERTRTSGDGGSPENLLVSHKLKDLFVSSPPALGDRFSENARLPTNGDLRRGGGRFLRPISATFRQRLLRRAWRPMLVAIPE